MYEWLEQNEYDFGGSDLESRVGYEWLEQNEYELDDVDLWLKGRR